MPDMEDTRRNFYIAGIYGLWGLMAAALSIPAAVYLLIPPKLRKMAEWVEAGDVSGLEARVPVEMAFRQNRVDGWKIQSEKTTAWVVKLSDAQVVAYGPQCTHLGCAYHWDDSRGHFLCPCHTSIFGVDGAVVSGPAPRPLDRYETKVENGRLLLGPLRAAKEKA
jgi:menaquinol-cytochrome c reductase iron-sulfur subunit